MTVATIQHTFNLPLQVMLDAAPSGMMLVDAEGTIVMANQLLAEQFGYVKTDLLGQPMDVLIPERFRSHHSSHFRGFFAAPEPRPMGSGRDLYGKRKDGSEFPVEIGLNPLDYQNVQYVVAALVDMTEQQRKVEIRVAALSHRLSLATQSAGIGIWEWDVVQNQLIWDDQMYALYGLTKEMQNKPYSMWMKIVHQEDRAMAEEAFQLALQGKQEFDTQFRVIWPDHSIHWIKGAGKVVRDSTGTALGMIGVNWDITAEKSAEEILLTYNEELEKSNQELDDFAYITSHDLKEPLRGIFNYATILLEDHAPDLNDDGKVRCETLCRLSRRMEELLDALLYFSRAGRSQMAMQPTDLDQVLAGVLETLDISLKEHGIFVSVPQTFPTVYCDSVRVGEIFRNLITNAMKYNDKDEKWIEIGFQDGGVASSHNKNIPSGNPVYFVKDNGVGIREKHFQAIFRMFKRLHGRDKFGGGTGAGLAFVKKLVERHGGKVWVESTVGEGSTFFFILARSRKHGDAGSTHFVG
ncbi:MAG: PAS domain S-box protein [Nitrospirota bacterium]|nr:PAS domain S-box protein [Nitrospirota bacterium]